MGNTWEDGGWSTGPVRMGCAALLEGDTAWRTQ